MAIFGREPSNGASNAGGVGINRVLSQLAYLASLHAVNAATGWVLSTRRRRDDDEMFMTRSLNVTPKTTEQHLIARSDKSVAYVTIKNSPRRFVLLKLTTEASRGLFATAELLVHGGVFTAGEYL